MFTSSRSSCSLQNSERNLNDSEGPMMHMRASMLRRVTFEGLSSAGQSSLAYCMAVR